MVYFSQLKGLGKSNGSKFFDIIDIDEARAFYEHDIFGKRLKEITYALLYSSKSPKEIMSNLDATKVKSCMTLFYLAAGDVLFKDVIDK